MKLVLITGASSGVGAATAREFINNGARVVLLARSVDMVNALAEELGDNAIAAPSDAANADQVSSLATSVIAEHGVPDVIIHCAGAGQWKRIEETSPAEAVTMMEAPYFAAFNVTHAFMPAMLKRRSGVIISVNSPACIVPWPSSVGYAAARCALYGFHNALSQDLPGTGVRACHVVFGKIDSEYFDNNPGVLEHMPGLTRIVPTLTSQKCAKILTGLAARPRHSAIYPLILRFFCGFGIIFPGITRWMLRF
jgi:NADP-dependent 3-hydroxy acid dehydrogenase YdfG